MIYTKKIFGAELMIEIQKGYQPEKIAKWADKVYYEHLEEIEDNALDDIIQNIGSMSFGERFLFSKTELEKLAQELMLSET